jgi:hypothetical protein
VAQQPGAATDGVEDEKPWRLHEGSDRHALEQGCDLGPAGLEAPECGVAEEPEALVGRDGEVQNGFGGG